MAKTNDIELGDLVKDRITGLTGVATAKTTWLWACSRVGIQPRELRDGRPIDAVWVDEFQLELVEKAVVNVTKIKKESHIPDSGGPQSDPSPLASERR